MREQESPTCVQVELTEGCNLRCTFCGLSGIRDKRPDFNYMGADTARAIVASMVSAGWRARVEFAMHGEPTLHPDAPSMVRIFREALPHGRLMMTSNGGGLMRKGDGVGNVRALFAAGLDILALDDYAHSGGLVPRLMESTGVDPDTHDPGALWNVRGLYVTRYPDDPAGNPHRAQPKGRRLLSIIRDISLPDVTTGTHATLNNHAGAGAPLNSSGMGKRCAKPFREVSVRWDGNVAICCNDWRGVFKVGNVNDTPLHELWQHPRFDAARRKLYLGERDFGPCHGCDATSYRVGLLPDKKGKASMPAPDATTHKLIREACDGAPYTAPVLRPWEKDEQGRPLPVLTQLTRSDG